MQMNQPVWFVEDSKLMSTDEGKKKFQEVADANSKSSSRLTILHGGDFDKASIAHHTNPQLNVLLLTMLACLLTTHSTHALV